MATHDFALFVAHVESEGWTRSLEPEDEGRHGPECTSGGVTANLPLGACNEAPVRDGCAVVWPATGGPTRQPVNAASSRDHAEGGPAFMNTSLMSTAPQCSASFPPAQRKMSTPRTRMS